jgi:hypothetical protein
VPPRGYPDENVAALQYLTCVARNCLFPPVQSKRRHASHAERRHGLQLPDGPGFAEAFAGIIEHQAVPLPVNPLLAAPDITAAATKTGAGLLVASLEQIHTLLDLGTEPPVLIGGAPAPWTGMLRLCSVVLKSTRKRVVLLPHDRSKPTTTWRHNRSAPERPPT